jgi:hypothetical protein
MPAMPTTSRRRRVRARRVAPALAFVLLVGAAVWTSPTPDARAQATADLAAKACAQVPVPHLVRAARGWEEDRGAEITWFPKEPDFVGLGLPHDGPWDYIQRVPMFWYGPGVIPANGRVDDTATLADIAPTMAELLRFPFEAPDGRVMRAAIGPEVGGEGYEPPKLLITWVWDAAGIDVLEEHRGAWPYLESLIPEGTWYENAFVGSSPASTAQAHATIGTGAFPATHGLVSKRMRVGGQIVTPWQFGGMFWPLPTLADLYDLANGNRPVVGLAGTVDIHFGMLGHGSLWNGGDRDIVLTRQVVGDTIAEEGFEWNLRHEYLPYYRLAGYANDVPGFERIKEELDRRDGQLDGRWRDNDIEQLLRGFDTPARTPYQQAVVETVIERERFGRDDLTDLLYLNYKEIDYVSHVWSMNSPEMEDAVAYQDAALERMVSFLNETVGEGEWAMVITADHSSMPDPAVSGGFQASTTSLSILLNQRFDGDGDDDHVVDSVQPSQLFVDEAELAEHGHTLDDVARYVMTLTKAQLAGGFTPEPGTEQEIAIPVAIPSTLFRDLPCLPERERPE